MAKLKDELSKTSLDILQEAGNIGIGNAITSLGQLISKDINMNVVEVSVEEVTHLFGIKSFDMSDYVVGNAIEVTGDIQGMLILVLKESSAKALIKQLLGYDILDLQHLNEIEYSVLQEIGNILGGSYLNAMTSLVTLKLNQSTPETVIDMVGPILAFPAMAFSENYTETLYIATEFSDYENAVNGTHFLILNKDSLLNLVSAMERLLYGYN
ncbi:hypothetical protein AN639_09105 [Candidatus Epulonipiscium fishelsonii]|uniref:Uncharacterized protein n=1 Tax=Candidatus Epulonipiscium fishelsonii TaxID=77094 RepID=A0ACC8XDR7_9FIRM|nr:hypothetical protein AN639_09105 [Epulopiscium sp. SCG-B05WGA-EpuloA1]ONI41004.1 hypothetical protein AN396_04390 [Epulopiscium sp. SCG-B11WGA-EpuloA1]ONI47429.1 hypothetical protein AN644_00460 [Epulopiscium sp. SCG-C06WGA-EpuloA1]